MKIDVEILDSKLSKLSETALSELQVLTKRYVEGVIDEAERLESSQNATSSKPEITASIINDAVFFVNKFRSLRRKSGWIKFIQILSFISALIAGGMWDSDEMKGSTSYMIIFLIVLVISVTSTAYLIIKGGGYE